MRGSLHLPCLSRCWNRHNCHGALTSTRETKAIASCQSSPLLAASLPHYSCQSSLLAPSLLGYRCQSSHLLASSLPGYSCQSLALSLPGFSCQPDQTSDGGICSLNLGTAYPSCDKLTQTMIVEQCLRFMGHRCLLEFRLDSVSMATCHPTRADWNQTTSPNCYSLYCLGEAMEGHNGESQLQQQGRSDSHKLGPLY